MALLGKKELRHTLLCERKAIDGAEKALLDRALCELIAAHPFFLSATVLLLFSPIKGEPDLMPLAEMAGEKGIVTALPRCAGGKMQFLTFTPETVLDFDEYGIASPPVGSPTVLPNEKTLCLLPGLAADIHGNRLGYGGGFYDRFLADFKGKTLFPLYHRFILPALPADPHDRPVDLIITEKGIVAPK